MLFRSLWFTHHLMARLRDYVVVSHRERRVTVHHRDDAGAWSTTTAVAGGSVTVTSLGAVLAVDAIYRHSAVA